jgi:4-cresol dehydrogenase (hydroxylating)
MEYNDVLTKRTNGSFAGSAGEERKAMVKGSAMASELVDRAQSRFTALLGADAVQQEGALFGEFRDPFEGPHARGHQPSLVVQPGSVEEVQATVRIAGELGLSLWTSSMGRNYGYGGSAPVVDGAVVLNLRRMNRILEIDARQGYARIEPGVSFAQL